MNHNMRKMYTEQEIADIVEKVLSKGVDKVNPVALVGLTHSFAELDSTLRTIIETAINSGQPAPCTQAQWSVIKRLLDDSLYFNYGGYTMIKVTTDGISSYVFGGGDSNVDLSSCISFNFNMGDNELTVLYHEI